MSTPLGLVAELTYRCPLRCPYCSNPVDASATELITDEWQRTLKQAGELGVVHALFTGGEPLLRPDLASLIATAREAGLYTNLITSGWGLTRNRAIELHEAGLDSVQLSFQSDELVIADEIAGATVHERKLSAAEIVHEMNWPLTLNVVLHRTNIQRLPEILKLAESLGAIRLELASVQFYGWAYRNRAALLPSRAEAVEADSIIAAFRKRSRLPIVYVGQDYYSDRPKPCMSGWGQRYIVVNPAGEAMPCASANVIQGMRFDNVRDRSLKDIWLHSDAFNRFRGTDWMPAPCASCDQRHVDFGGCRCQAALLTGDATRTDPACEFAPERGTITPAQLVPLGMMYRTNPTRRR